MVASAISSIQNVLLARGLITCGSQGNPLFPFRVTNINLNTIYKNGKINANHGFLSQFCSQSFPSEENVVMLLKHNSNALTPDKTTVYRFCPSWV